VIVLKLRHKDNPEELDAVIRRGRTLEGGQGSRQVPEDAQQGDLAIWYAGDPDRDRGIRLQ
jgi:hypothetical protein